MRISQGFQSESRSKKHSTQTESSQETGDLFDYYIKMKVELSDHWPWCFAGQMFCVFQEEWSTGRCSGWHHAHSVLELWEIPGFSCFCPQRMLLIEPLPLLSVSLRNLMSQWWHYLTNVSCLFLFLITIPNTHITFCTLQQYQALTNEPAHTQMSYTMSLLRAEGQSDFLKAIVSQWQR